MPPGVETMLASRRLPEQFAAWNRLHGAPFGRVVRGSALLRRCLPASMWERLRGPFAIQPNNDTRTFEYPWAYYAAFDPEAGRGAALRAGSAAGQPGMKVVELGGGLAGFQFVLDRAGCAVVNIDPGLEANGVGWPCDEASMRKLNARFGTRVDLRPTVAGRAGLDSGAYDRVFSISVLEHLPEGDIREAMECAFRWLKPGGLMIMTIDLSLNLYPFCSRQANEYGCNQDIHKIVAQQPFEMVSGNPAELYGFAEFDVDRILCRLEEYLIGSIYPTMVQCVVLRKPG